MEGKGIFISSCSRRQLARRRPTRSVLRLQFVIAMIVITATVGVVLAGRGAI